MVKNNDDKTFNEEEIKNNFEEDEELDFEDPSRHFSDLNHIDSTRKPKRELSESEKME